jgi:hypothetical protein
LWELGVDLRSNFAKEAFKANMKMENVSDFNKELERAHGSSGGSNQSISGARSDGT